MLLFLLKGTLYNTSYQIENINYPPSTRSHYENTELFVLTSKLLRGKFYSALQVGGVGGILEQIQASYPFVRTLDIKHTDQKTISVEYQFAEPDFLVKMNGKRYGVWQDGFTEELHQNWILGQSAFVVDTPQYLSGTNSMSGFFYEVSYERYQKAIPLIKENFPDMKRFVYLVGSKNFMIFTDRKIIYLHRDSLKHQIDKYQWLKKYFANFEGTYEIDLGSLLENKVIIKE